MPVRFLSDAQREQLSGFPAEFDDEALDRLFTLSGADVTEACRRRGDENRLGWSLLLCGLRVLGFCPDDLTTAPVGVVRFVARQLGVDSAVLAGYGLSLTKLLSAANGGSPSRFDDARGDPAAVLHHARTGVPDWWARVFNCRQFVCDRRVRNGSRWPRSGWRSWLW